MERRLVLKSGIFDPIYYAVANPAILVSDPKIVSSPSRLFDHYWKIGRHASFRPSALFDPVAYLESNPDVSHAKIDPLLHYIKFGRHEGRYAGATGLSSSEIESAAERVRQTGLFDEVFYLSQQPAVREAGIDPAAHYVVNGAERFFECSPDFSMQAYLAENADVRHGRMNPLLHYSEFGRHEGRVLRPTIDDVTWLPDRRSPLPDDVAHLESMAGISFFSRFGFSTESNGSMRWVAEATEELATMTPALKSSRLEPDVSIVIPVYGQLPFVLNCLDSLARHKSRFLAEIIVCDDASPADSETERLKAIPWIRYLRRPTNGGFIDACNWAAEHARGRYVVLLNSDTRVARGWLDELIGTFSLFPKAGLVGSKLFNDDLSLQEAGGIFWRDGSAWNYGRNDDPNHPRYCFARRIDFCSGAAIAVPTALWHHVGGFDVAFRPAYCEDADLAFRLRDLGYETWYQPLARVIHYEGKTHGRDLTKGIKAYQVTNMKKFAERWSSELAEHLPNGVRPHDEANRPATKRLLVIDSTNPAPDIDSGSIVTMQMISSYQELGFQVSFLAQSNYLFDPRFGPSLQRSGVECLYHPFVRTISEVLDQRNNYNVVLVYRVNVATAVFDTLRARLPRAPIMFHNIDLHYLREMREAKIGRDADKLQRAIENRRIELAIHARADCAMVTSSAEISEIQARMPLPLRTLVEMPICIEVNKSLVEYNSRRDVIFLAGFAHPPNVDAAVFLAKEIWPLVQERLPADARLLLVGSHPVAAVKALASDRIVVTGHVPELQPWFEAARVFVAPLRFGAGVKGKVIQSLARGTPCVLTQIAAEGIGLEDGTHAIISDTPEGMAAAIIELYFNESRWTQMQQASYEFVSQHFSRETGTRLCQHALEVAYRARAKRSEIALQKELTDILEYDSGAAAIDPV